MIILDLESPKVGKYVSRIVISVLNYNKISRLYLKSKKLLPRHIIIKFEGFAFGFDPICFQTVIIEKISSGLY